MLSLKKLCERSDFCYSFNMHRYLTETVCSGLLRALERHSTCEW